jgi:hypothetical protein
MISQSNNTRLARSSYILTATTACYTAIKDGISSFVHAIVEIAHEQPQPRVRRLEEALSKTGRIQYR